MEILPSVKIQHSRTLLFIADSNRKTHIYFKCQPNFIFSKSFRQIQGLRLELHCSLNEEFSIAQHSLENMPLSVDLEPISSETQFDRVLAEAQQLQDSVIILWMASWCRKCIYVKPKLEKLAADYYPRIRFYSVDVNSVPQKLVDRAGVTKMPTIQLWKDGKKQGEVIGGHKAYLVVNEVREMIIDNENTIV